MILFYNPKATKPRNRRFPLSILAIAAVIEGKELSPFAAILMDEPDIVVTFRPVGILRDCLEIGGDCLVRSALGLQIHGEDPIRGLVAALRDSCMLLLLDNCEHVVDEVAGLALALLGGAKDVAILATSREPLRVAGESEYRLGPLRSPQASSKLTAAEAATFPVVQLFVERVAAIVEDFVERRMRSPHRPSGNDGRRFPSGTLEQPLVAHREDCINLGDRKRGESP